MWIASLSWSPDSRFIAYTTKTRYSDKPLSDIELWIVDVSNGKRSLVVQDPTFSSDLFYVPDVLDVIHWSENSQDIIYTDYVSDEGIKTDYQIDVIAKQLTSTTTQLENSESTALQVINASLPCGVPQFSQNDPAWSGDIMLSCGLKIGPYGCAITSTSMIFKYYGVDTTPKSMNSCLGNKACPMDWDTAATNCDSNKVNYYGSPGFSWNTIESELNNGRPVILELYKTDQHFVVVIAGSGNSMSGYTIIDSWDGQIKNLSSYSTWTTKGLRLYSGTPSCQSSCSSPNLISPNNYTSPGNTITTL